VNVNARLLAQAAQSRQVLQAQEISTTAPGTILGDVQTMIDLIGATGLPTQSKHGSLPNAALAEMNRRLSAPIEVPLSRPLLRDYPNIAGVYVLLRVMDLARNDRARLCLNPQALSYWNDLNPAEKYFALLEAWLLFAEDAVLGGSAWTVFEQFDSNLSFLSRHVTCRSWKTFDEDCHTSRFRVGISTWNVQLQARLGLIEVRARPLAGRLTTTRGWLMQKARRTPWGEAVAWAVLDLLNRTRDEDEDDWHYYFQRPEDAEFGFLQPAFAPYFPEWKRVFRVTDPAPQPGRYVFKVAIEARHCAPAWRRIAVPGAFSLDDLAMAVLSAFDFIDMAHLYEFRYHDQLAKLRRYYHPECDEGPWADQIQLEEAGLAEKQIIKFRFDFGDDWRFTLRLEKIEPLADSSAVQMLAAEGESPKQYPSEN
jgi:Plasmid pRiA4b ORF-3-like protein